jgi:hypothetical protein
MDDGCRPATIVWPKSKICKECLMDVTKSRRIKNNKGEYLCESCHLRKSQMPEMDIILSPNEVLFHQEQPYKKFTKRIPPRVTASVLRHALTDRTLDRIADAVRGELGKMAASERLVGT